MVYASSFQVAVNSNILSLENALIDILVLDHPLNPYPSLVGSGNSPYSELTRTIFLFGLTVPPSALNETILSSPTK